MELRANIEIEKVTEVQSDLSEFTTFIPMSSAAALRSVWEASFRKVFTWANGIGLSNNSFSGFFLISSSLLGNERSDGENLILVFQTFTYTIKLWAASGSVRASRL